MAHSRLSPSKAHRWLACPGSVREEEKYPDNSGKSAIDGTKSHLLLEHCIKGGLADPMNMVGVIMPDHEGGSFLIDKDGASRVKVAIDYLNERYKPNEVMSECQVNPEYLTGRDDMFGTLDIAAKGTDFIEIIDYKDGMVLVNVEDNPQLEIYMLGVLSHYKIPMNNDYPFKKIKLTIIQPKLEIKGIDPISSTEIDIKSRLHDIVRKFYNGAARTDDIDAPLVSGELHCHYCKHKNNCSALLNTSLSVIDNYISNDTVTDNLEKLSIVGEYETANVLSTDRLVEIYQSVPLLKQMIENVETEIENRLRNGQEVKGYKLVNGRGSKVWSLPENEIEDKLIKMGIPRAVIYTHKLVSPSQACKFQWEKKDGSMGKLSPNQIKLLENEYITKMAGKPTVVPESDERPSILIDVSDMFTQTSEQIIPDWLTD